MRLNDFIQQFSLACWVCLSNVLLSPWSFWCWGQGCVLSNRQPAVLPLFCKHHFVEHYQGLLLTNGLWGLRKSSKSNVLYIIRVFLLTWGLCFQGLNMWNALPEVRTNWTVFFPTFPKHHNFLILVSLITCPNLSNLSNLPNHGMRHHQEISTCYENYQNLCLFSTQDTQEYTSNVLFYFRCCVERDNINKHYHVLTKKETMDDKGDLSDFI